MMLAVAGPQDLIPSGLGGIKFVSVKNLNLKQIRFSLNT
ncbi:MAG: hypothetical protein CM1200mP28_00970 [Deltaproteobacteria bacterium]|nr:MAG: hypothetical protein CM1200mP28_00970 [Deltaproteobacteria bacterium]